MKFFSWSHAWVVFLAACLFISMRNTDLFQPPIALLIYGVFLANQRVMALEKKARQQEKGAQHD